MFYRRIVYQGGSELLQRIRGITNLNNKFSSCNKIYIKHILVKDG